MYMSKEKAELKLKLEKVRLDAKVCGNYGNYYLADKLEKLATKLSRQYCEMV